MPTHCSLTSPEKTNPHKRKVEANLHPKTAGLVISLFKVMEASSTQLYIFNKNKKKGQQKNEIYMSPQPLP
jgi:hypothetical protein